MSAATLPLTRSGRRLRNRSWRKSSVAYRVYSILQSFSDDTGRVTITHSELAREAGCFGGDARRHVLRVMQRLSQMGRAYAGEAQWRVVRSCSRRGSHRGNSYVVMGKRLAWLNQLVRSPEDLLNGSQKQKTLPSHVTPHTPKYRLNIPAFDERSPAFERFPDYRGWQHKIMPHIRKAVNNNGFLSNDQKTTVINILGHILWKRRLQRLNGIQLGGWVSANAGRWRTKAVGGALGRWLIGQLSWLHIPKRGRTRERDRARSRLYGDLYRNALEQIDHIANTPAAQLYASSLEAWAGISGGIPIYSKFVDFESWKAVYIRRAKWLAERDFGEGAR